ncbi:GTR9 protein, partial [Nyctiprogne leucopyga]|nr:GTR9 protein [Nyctiprogne leucopyga]
AVKQLWGDGDHMAEINDMMAEQEAIRGEKAKSICDLFRDKAVRWQFITLVLVASCMQLIGANVVYFYAYNVFIKAGIPPAQTHYVSLGVGITEILSTVLCSSIIDRFGRRILLWGGYLLMALILVLLEISLLLSDWYVWMPYCSLCLIILFVVVFGVGPAGATISIMVEIFSQSFRPSAFLIVGCINWMGLFVLGMIFPLIV